jgi:peroxin-2
MLRWSMYSTGATYGSALQHLEYKTSKGNIPGRLYTILYAICHYGVPYLWSRRGNREALQNFDAFFKCLRVLNLFLFLYQGTYRNLSERLLSLKLVSTTHQSTPVNFEFLNRQLLWHAFTEGVLCMMPFIKSLAHRWHRGAILSSHGCGLCGQEWIIIPYKTIPCQHMFCYYCIATYRMEQKDQTFCPICHSLITQFQYSE